MVMQRASRHERTSVCRASHLHEERQATRASHVKEGTTLMSKISYYGPVIGFVIGFLTGAVVFWPW